MTDLMTLWRSRVSAILGIVRAGETEHREVATMAAQVGADYHGRFLVELLQNASDQASAAGLRDSSVVIIRTAEVVGLANQGLPFSEAGLRSVTSLGLSTKNPQEAIGNKGVGFKSVFQVSHSPEIYSSRVTDASFVDAPGLMFKLSLDPFASRPYEEILRSMIAEQLSVMGPVDPSLTVDRAVSEIRAAAPFKFPLPLTVENLRGRTADLAEQPNAQTLVVLPLSRGGNTPETVENAIDELFQENGAGILFLPAVSTIKVVDRVRGFTRTISRQALSEPTCIEGYGFLVEVETRVQGDGVANKRSWRLIKRRMGTPDVVSPDQAEQEAVRINGEARKLPGPNWDAVRSSPVGVAIPLPISSPPDGSLLLGARGRVCIGLPTKDPTGTPAWVNAHFHGTISREGIDLHDNAYNALLFAEAVRLHGALVADLKTDVDVSIRRAATLAFEHNNGGLANVLHSAQGQGQGDVILSVDGLTYQKPNDTVLPEPADFDALLLMVPQSCELKGFGLRLPEVDLMRGARSLLLSLVGTEPDPSKIVALFLDRAAKGVSLLEHAAVSRRGDGPAFWEKFLSWIVGRFTSEQLSDQRILPIGEDVLAKPSERVFLPPAPRRPADALADDDGEIAELPVDLAQSLKFLDDVAVIVRKPDSRDLTEFASSLAPDTGRGLVRRPRLDDLINDAVGPLMQQLKEDDASKESGIRLLRQAVQWLWELSDAGRDRLTRDVLRVPVLTAGGSWAWVPPGTTYLSAGWLGNPADQLLREAYGHDQRRLLVPWEMFTSSFVIAPEERDAWIGALELLGVSRSPKILRPRPGPRAAPLASRSTHELTINLDRSPIGKAEPFWRSYLESTRKRRAKTAGGQKFDFRSVTWIDGLERETSRTSVVKLMLLNPAAYETETSTILERQLRPNDDAEPVPSLWVHAIAANAWQVIPTQRGPVAVRDAWLLEGQQRGLSRRRLALLNQVEAPYDKAQKLLQGLGVTTFQRASVARLLHAINELGRACAGYDAESRRTALALAEDLFGHLQITYGRHPEMLSDLKVFCFPLERNREAVGVLGEQIRIGYFNDDPVRAGFIPGFADSQVWPLETRYAYRDLVAELRRQLGESVVVYTSLAMIESRFAEDDTLRRAPLVDWLATTFPQHAVASDLACLMAYTGRQDTDPSGDEFRRTWKMFQQAMLVFGSFLPDAPTPYFYDRTTGLLQVSSDLSDAEKVKATWMLVGLSYRDTWAAYSQELAKGTPGKFLIDHRITSAQRENVEIAIGLSSTERFKHVRAAMLALWCVRFGKQPIVLFDQEWNINARSVRGLSDWLGRSDLADAFAGALGTSEEEASLTIIRAAGINSDQWQQARLALGMERWRFTQKVRAWCEIMTELLSILKTCVARSAMALPSDIEPILRDPRFFDVPEGVACEAEDDHEVLPSVLHTLEAVVVEHATLAGIDLLQRRLATVKDQAKTSLATVDLDDAPGRDVRVYRDEDEGKRSRDAQARLDGLMAVASALAQQLGESFPIDDVRSDARVKLLVSGWWANCFTIMAAIQRVLQAKAPKTAQRMSDERVFRDPAPANELFLRFKELTGFTPAGPPPLPEKKIAVFGQSQTENEVGNDLLRGTAGLIGQSLKGIASQRPLEPTLGNIARAKAELPGAKQKSRDGGAGGAGGHESRKDRELTGLLGEAFVYEHFRLVLPGFDEMAWRSCNRNLYGLEGPGDDSLGYDFSYRDTENRLTVRSDRPVCYIEVKSSAGEGRGSFQMSANEWEKARECHESADSVYIILRLAHVRDNPQIIDAIIDPFGLYRNGQLALSAQDMWVYLGAAQATVSPSADPPPTPEGSE